MENVTIRVNCDVDGIVLLAYITDANGEELTVEFVDVATTADVNECHARSYNKALR